MIGYSYSYSPGSNNGQIVATSVPANVFRDSDGNPVQVKDDAGNWVWLTVND